MPNRIAQAKASGATVLMDAYLERRQDLVRFFAGRLNSVAAAEDLIQDLFVKVQAVDADTEIHNPSAFLHRLASNLMLDRLRQGRRSRAREDAWYETRRSSVGGVDVVDEPSAEDRLVAHQRLERLTEAIETLSPRTREAFVLHKLNGMTHGETAEAMGISRSAVEKHIIGALKVLLRRDR